MNLARVQHLFTHDGPFISVHLDVTRVSEDAVHQMDTDWSKAQEALSAAGADEALLGRIGELVRQPTGLGGTARRTVVAAEDILLDDLRTGRGAWSEVSAVGPLPDLSGWLTQVDDDFPFVLVVADREGADIDMYRSVSKPESQHETVEGQTLHITKVPAGEWAELQHHTEEVWRRNARNVADAVNSTYKEHRPRAVVLAGEVRARAEIHEALGDGPVPVTEVEAGGRAAGSSDDALWQAVHQSIAQLSAFEVQQVVDDLDERSGQNRAVARGLRDVLEALVRGQVERLLVDLHETHGQTVAPGDYLGLQLPSSAQQAGRLPADQVLVAAGARTDAELTLLPIREVGGDGVAALLRWES